ncbi:hypothetical protein RhiirC2_716851, partial [Rhizophagus irregularis]
MASVHARIHALELADQRMSQLELQWTTFADDLDKLCLINLLVFDAWPFNQKCEYLHSRIIKAAKSNLSAVTVGNTCTLKKPKDLEILYLPERWSNAYVPLADVSPAIFGSLMNPPTLDEWSSTISSMPNDKVTGLSMISYEMLKHLGLSASALLFNLICTCLSDTNIPDLWRQATVFPISKPHEWKCQLKNTRPITLLE